MQAALFYVLKESFKVYKAVSEGLINLADKFFDMDYFNAQKALEIYKESILSAERLQVSLQLFSHTAHPLPGNRHMPILVVRIASSIASRTLSAAGAALNKLCLGGAGHVPGV